MRRPRPDLNCRKCYGTGRVALDEYVGDGYAVTSAECECIARQYEPDHPMNLFVVRKKKTWPATIVRVLVIAVIVAGAYVLGTSLL